MAWTSPMTFSAGAVLTAAQLNTHLRDNLNETAPAKATTGGRIFVSTGANAIAERAIEKATVNTAQTTTSTTYTNLATTGPVVTVTTGTRALAFVTVQSENTGTNQNFAGVAVSGATTIAAADDDAYMHQNALANIDNRMTATILFTTLTAGSNTFTVQYRTTAGTAAFQSRMLVVVAL